jgi:hypothetical protein
MGVAAGIGLFLLGVAMRSLAFALRVRGLRMMVRAFARFFRARGTALHGFCTLQRAFGLRVQAHKEERETFGDRG